MTNEQKQLLLKYLCAMLPYGVIVRGVFLNYNKDLDRIQYEECDKRLEYRHLDRYETLKPYLRPMSSMTEEEKEELKQEHSKDERLFAECLRNVANGDDSMRGKVIPHFATDWCNKNHFDYRGLIPMGLALEAPEDMYNKID